MPHNFIRVGSRHPVVIDMSKCVAFHPNKAADGNISGTCFVLDMLGGKHFIHSDIDFNDFSNAYSEKIFK